MAWAIGELLRWVSKDYNLLICQMLCGVKKHVPMNRVICNLVLINESGEDYFVGSGLSRWIKLCWKTEFTGSRVDVAVSTGMVC